MRLFIILALIPIFSLGQNDLERNIETTLIDDVEHQKSIGEFYLDKSYALSNKILHEKLYKFIDAKKMDDILIKFIPNKNPKSYFKKAIELDDFIEN